MRAGRRLQGVSALLEIARRHEFDGVDRATNSTRSFWKALEPGPAAWNAKRTYYVRNQDPVKTLIRTVVQRKEWRPISTYYRVKLKSIGLKRSDRRFLTFSSTSEESSRFSFRRG